eukprot:EG_transcript_13582
MFRIETSIASSTTTSAGRQPPRPLPWTWTRAAVSPSKVASRPPRVSAVPNTASPWEDGTLLWLACAAATAARLLRSLRSWRLRGPLSPGRPLLLSPIEPNLLSQPVDREPCLSRARAPWAVAAASGMDSPRPEVRKWFEHRVKAVEDFLAMYSLLQQTSLDRDVSEEDEAVLAEVLRSNKTMDDVHGAEAMIAKVRKNEPLDAVRLSRNPISDVAAFSLSDIIEHCSDLYALYLNETGLSDPATAVLARTVAHHPTLKWCHLSGNHHGDPAARALAEMLQSNSSLQWLDLSDNAITDDGAVALAHALRSNTTLLHLNLKGNPLTGTAVQAFQECVRVNSTVEEVELSGWDYFAE